MNNHECPTCKRQLPTSASWYAEQISKILGIESHIAYQSKKWVEKVYKHLKEREVK